MQNAKSSVNPMNSDRSGAEELPAATLRRAAIATVRQFFGSRSMDQSPVVEPRIIYSQKGTAVALWEQDDAGTDDRQAPYNCIPDATPLD